MCFVKSFCQNCLVKEFLSKLNCTWVCSVSIVINNNINGTWYCRICSALRPSLTIANSAISSAIGVIINYYTDTANSCASFFKSFSLLICIFVPLRIDTNNDPICGHKTVGHNGQYLKNGHNCGYDIFWCGHKYGYYWCLFEEAQKCRSATKTIWKTKQLLKSYDQNKIFIRK